MRSLRLPNSSRDSLMYDDESMNDRAEKLRTEIGLSPLRSLRDSLNRAGEKGEERGIDIRLALVRSGAIFVLHPSLGNFYFLATSPHSLHSLLSTMNDLFFHPFSLCLCSTLLPCFPVKFRRLRVYLKCIFNKFTDLTFIFNSRRIQVVALILEFSSLLNKIFKDNQFRLDAKFLINFRRSCSKLSC